MDGEEAFRVAVSMSRRSCNPAVPPALMRMADDNEIVIRFLNMVRGSLDDRTLRLLEELRLKRPIVLNRPERDTQKPSPQKDDGQKGTDEPWKLPGQSSQDPAQRPPPKPDYSNPQRKT